MLLCAQRASTASTMERGIRAQAKEGAVGVPGPLDYAFRFEALDRSHDPVHAGARFVSRKPPGHDALQRVHGAGVVEQVAQQLLLDALLVVGRRLIELVAHAAAIRQPAGHGPSAGGKRMWRW